MREETVTETMPDKPGKKVQKKEQVTVEINLKRGVDVAYLDKIGVADVLGKQQLTRKDVPLILTVSREDNVRLRQLSHAFVITKVKEEK